MQKTITIRDVAKRAGVGISTVSRVVNGGTGVNEATQERVRAIIAECGYAPNSNARQLKQRRADAAAVIVRGVGSMFLASVLELLQPRIEALGLRFLAHYIDEHDDEAAAARAIHAEKKVRGIVLLGGSVVGRADQLDLPNVPCVYATLDARTVRAKNVFSVSVDDRAAAYAATDYLLARGHRNIAVLGGRLDAENPIALRFRGVLDAFSARGLAFPRAIPARGLLIRRDPCGHGRCALSGFWLHRRVCHVGYHGHRRGACARRPRPLHPGGRFHHGV